MRRRILKTTHSTGNQSSVGFGGRSGEEGATEGGSAGENGVTRPARAGEGQEGEMPQTSVLPETPGADAGASGRSQGNEARQGPEGRGVEVDFETLTAEV